MTDLTTDRLILHPATVEQAEQIVQRAAGAGDSWAHDFPFEGDVIAAGMFLRATHAEGEQQPFGLYVIERRCDARAIGAIGFKGRPRQGSVEIGYGLAPSGRGAGLAAEAAAALIVLASRHGLVSVAANTAKDNTGSQRTLERIGMTRIGEQGQEYRYRIDL